MKFETGLKDDNIRALVQDVKDEILEFATIQESSTCALRDDYQEFVELVIIFLGGVPVGVIRFRLPGIMHHARWMSKVIYSLKKFLFKSQFITETSPYYYFQWMKILLEYSRIHAEIAKAASEKFSKHLWYLSEDLSGLSFFDSDVPVLTKRKIVEVLQNKKVKTKIIYKNTYNYFSLKKLYFT